MAFLVPFTAKFSSRCESHYLNLISNMWNYICWDNTW